MTILAAKLYTPRPPPKVVVRSGLVERLNAGLHHKLTIIAAPAGFGKTTLAREWAAVCGRQVVWLSLDTDDSDHARFLTYLVAALRTIEPNIGEGLLSVLQSPQPPPPETLLTTLLNEIAEIPDNFVLVLDDYHLIEARLVDATLTFLIEHLPPQMRLVIVTREDPQLPLARLRARDQLTELRASDLRFSPSEAARFLNQVMGLDLSAEDIDALETRTEGWIAGLQLAAISLRGHKDATGFIKSFTGSSRFIVDYLAEEVLERQPDEVRDFLLRTSVLERMCASLCEEVLKPNSDTVEAGSLPVAGSPQQISSQAMLEKLDRSNLFIIPLDNERRWYRYHHLWADLLRQRLHQSAASSTGDIRQRVNELHIRASQWFEDNGLEIEAFQHAAAASDFERIERLIEGEGVPLHFRGAGAPIRNWLESLPRATLNARPSLWVTYASVLLMTGQPNAVEEKLLAAEAALQSLQGAEPDDKTRDLVGRVASLRATLAVMQHDAEAIITQSRRALEYLHPNNLPLRTATTWTLGYAYQVQGDRAAASQAYAEVISTSKAFGPSIYTTAAILCLGQVQETENLLQLAADSYRQVLILAGDPPQGIACEAHLGLLRIYYQWNDLGAAEHHGQQCAQLLRQMENVNTAVALGVWRARLKLAQGDMAGAVPHVDEAEALVRQHDLMFRMPDVAAAQVLILLRQHDKAEAAHLAQTHSLPIGLARVHLAQGNTSAALALLEPLRDAAEAKGWADERLQMMVLQAVAYHAHGEKSKAVQLLDDALQLAEPGGFIRIFVDEGTPMTALLREAAKRGTAPTYVRQLRAAISETGEFGEVRKGREFTGRTPVAQLLIEPLSERELDVLRLLRTDLDGPGVARGLMVSVNTVRTHTRNIYTKLGVNSRREAIRRAEELHLL